MEIKINSHVEAPPAPKPKQSVEQMVADHALTEYGEPNVHPVKFLTDIMMNEEEKTSHRMTAAIKLLDKIYPTPKAEDVSGGIPQINVLGTVNLNSPVPDTKIKDINATDDSE